MTHCLIIITNSLFFDLVFNNLFITVLSSCCFLQLLNIHLYYYFNCFLSFLLGFFCILFFLYLFFRSCHTIFYSLDCRFLIKNIYLWFDMYMTCCDFDKQQFLWLYGISWQKYCYQYDNNIFNYVDRKEIYLFLKTWRLIYFFKYIFTN